jgi:DNA-binding transcriptional regulator YiaG
LWYFSQKSIFSFKKALDLNRREFGFLRQNLQKTQKQMAILLGTSLKAVQSFEQGWRKVPMHIERQLLFLLSTKRMTQGNSCSCWDIRNCPPEVREVCPAWEFNVGGLCWFINGTICLGKVQGSWTKKMKVCRKCEVFAETVNPRGTGLTGRARIIRGRKRRKEKDR